MKKEIKTHLKRNFLVFCILMVLGVFTPFLYGATFGSNVVSETASDIRGDTTTEIAINIASWEHKNFKSPYFTDKYDSWYNEYLNIYIVDGIPRLPLLFGPSSWQISNRLANCGGYSQVFDSLAEEKDIDSSIVSAPREDHVWNSYINDNGNRVVIDTSGSGIIENKTNFAERKGFTYIIRENDGQEKAVTDEYRETYNITVDIKKIDEIEIYSRYLKRNYDRYDSIYKIIDSKEDRITKLGSGPLTVKLKNNFGPIERVYSKKIHLEKNRNIESIEGFNKTFSINT
jgi:hypothetical protein